LNPATQSDVNFFERAEESSKGMGQVRWAAAGWPEIATPKLVGG